MSEVRKIKTENQERVETGAIQFDDDWPGLFIRGDDCAFLAMQITTISEYIREQFENEQIHFTLFMACGVLEKYAEQILDNVALVQP